MVTEKIKSANPNLGALQEYRKREREFLNRAKDLEQITAARDAQKQKYDTLRKQRLDEFMTGFNTISAKLKEMYQVHWSSVSLVERTIHVYDSLDDYAGWECRT